MATAPSSEAERLPIILVPGFVCTCLEVESSTVCPSWEGSKAWLGLNRLGFQAMHAKGMWDDKDAKTLKNKWIEHVKLAAPDQESQGIHLKAVPGLQGVLSLDPDSFFGAVAQVTPIFIYVAQVLEAMGYKEGVDMAAASYDWRFAPSILQEREKYFDHLADTVEKLDRHSTGVVLLGHSMGNKTVAYFLEHAKKSRGQAWIDRHIYSWMATGAPFLGAFATLRSTVMGDKFGLDSFVSDSEARALARSLSASPWLLPTGCQAQKPCVYLRRGGVLEVRNFRALVSHCGIDSARNKLLLTVEVSFPDVSKSALTTKSASSFDGTSASWLVENNLMQFAGPPELTKGATLQVTVKEKGMHDDKDANVLKRFSKGIIAGAKLIGEAAKGRKSLGVPKAATSPVDLQQLLRSRPARDGFVEVQLPVTSSGASLFGGGASAASGDSVFFEMRWLDFKALCDEWLGSQNLTASVASPVTEAPVCHSRRHHEVYDPVGTQELLKIERCEQMLKTLQTYYDGDPLTNWSGFNDCPPVKRVLAVHGVNLPTEEMYALRINTVRFKATELQTRLVLDDEAELSKKSDALRMEAGVVKAIGGAGTMSGDGTVPLASLEHCREWVSSGLELKLVHLEQVEHRVMLTDPLFHQVIKESLLLRPPAHRAQPSQKYFIAGTWKNWTPEPMEWDGGFFVFVVRIGSQGWESFQLVLNGSWDMVIYPSVKSAGPAVPHEICGPDKGNGGKDWIIGKAGMKLLTSGLRPGLEFKVKLEVDAAGNAQKVTWDPFFRVQHVTATGPFQPPARATGGKWQVAKTPSNSAWWDFPAEAAKELSAAAAAGSTEVRVSFGGNSYNVNLTTMLQTNLTTGKQRQVRLLRE